MCVCLVGTLNTSIAVAVEDGVVACVCVSYLIGPASPLPWESIEMMLCCTFIHTRTVISSLATDTIHVAQSASVHEQVQDE